MGSCGRAEVSRYPGSLGFYSLIGYLLFVRLRDNIAMPERNFR